ncbi:hypothetical protein R3I94_006684 [Phoxinus phoxinus]
MDATAPQTPAGGSLPELGMTSVENHGQL